MLGLRALSSIIIVPPVLAAIWFGGHFYIMLLVLVGCFIGREMANLASIRLNVFVALNILACAGTPFLTAYAGSLVGTVWLLVAVIGFCILIRFEIVGIAERFGFISLCILAHAALMALTLMRGADFGSVALILYVVTIIAATDIGAYFAGRSIGGPKLAPKISPNKTWAGLIGGTLAAGASGYAFAESYTFPFINELNAANAIGSNGNLVILSMILAPVAQIGDLLESWIKRCRGVKDSGNLIPGHGGILDRVDGYLTAAPLVALIALLDKGGPYVWP